MKHFWYRINNFYNYSRARVNPSYAGSVPIHQVTYLNDAPYLTFLRKICLIRYSDDKHSIFFQPSPFHREQFLKNYTLIFQKELPQFIYSSDELSIPLNDDAIYLLIRLFKHINAETGLEELPEILLRDIIEVYTSKDLNLAQFCAKKHLIGEQRISNAHINPLRKKSKSLHNFLETLRYAQTRGDEERELKKLLVAGEDPNQLNSLDESPLQLVLKLPNRVLPLLLLCYGANPWQVNNWISGLSALDYAKKHYEQTQLTFIQEASKTARIPAKKSPPISRLKHIDTLSHDHFIRTYLNFVKPLYLTSEFKSVTLLTPQEKSALFILYQQIFSSKNEDLNKAFVHTFAPEPGKFVDILRNAQGQIVGVDSFIIRKTETELFVMIDISMLHPNYQGYGFMPLIDYRLAFALQLLYPAHQVSIVFLAASYSAIRRLENSLFFPKYQPEGMKEKLKQIMKEQFNYPLTWRDAADKVFFTVCEEHQITVVNNGPKNASQGRIMEEFYHTHLRGNQEGYVPVLVFPGDDLLQTMHEMLAPRSINFKQQYEQFAMKLASSKTLPAFLHPEHQVQKKNTVFASNYAFWSNKQIPINDPAFEQGFALPKNDLCPSHY